MNHRITRLGVDIGRVIISAESHAQGDTAFFEGDDEAANATPEVDGAIASINELTRLFGGRVWLVSKAGPRTQARTLRWLAAHDFFDRTGVDSGNVRFCLARADKRTHCAELSLTHFVDDRLEVHAAIRDIVDHRYLFGPQVGPIPDYVEHVIGWPQARLLIEATL